MAEKIFSQNSILRFTTEPICFDGSQNFQSKVWGGLYVYGFLSGKSRRCLFFWIEDSALVPDIAAEISAISEAGDLIFVALAPCIGGHQRARKLWLEKTQKKVQKNGYFFEGPFATNPDPIAPQILFHLNERILNYVEVISHRCGDHLLKFLAKKMRVALMGTSSWRGWVFFVVQKGKPADILPDISNRYLFLTPGREVALVFDKGGGFPDFVEKKGPRECLQQEWDNHQWACKTLAHAVPSLLSFSADESHAVLRMEYIPEKNLPNVVADSTLRRRCLRRQTLATLDFFKSVFLLFCGGSERSRQALSEAMQGIIQDGLEFILPHGKNDGARSRMGQALQQGVFLLIPQHGDFCVRNVLYRSEQEMVLIDWEDFNASSLPYVDFHMVIISLVETWGQFDGDSGGEFYKQVEVQNKLAELNHDLQEKLGLTDQDRAVSVFLSLAYLAGNNLCKGRIATARKIRDEFFRLAELIEAFEGSILSGEKRL